ncbi:MAG: GNAT family N-acetyltransferase [Tannerella sp.]|jgi:ribosomal protein S18 acetylase RimI-like enzyme|nr:GNAT family N-acetyltransferase [Tannerella sp.]
MKRELKTADSSRDYNHIRNLMLEYSKWLGVDLSFQQFDYELDHLSRVYVRLYIAYVNTLPAGCIGFKKRSEEQCELKRMFVKEEYQGKHIGKHLLRQAIADAKALGYLEMVLDTSLKLEAAIHLYRKFGFREIPAYYHNPNEDVTYMSLQLTDYLKQKNRTLCVE